MKKLLSTLFLTFLLFLPIELAASRNHAQGSTNTREFFINVRTKGTHSKDRTGFPFNLQAFYDEDTQEIWVEYESLTYQPTPQGVTYITNSSNVVVISCPRVDATIDVSSLLYDTYTLNIEWGDYIATGTVTIF